MSSVGVPGSRYPDARDRIISHRLDILGELAAGGITTDRVQPGTWPRPGTAGGRERPRPSRPQGARAVAVGRTMATAQAPNQATAGGLVIYAKSVRDTAQSDVDAEPAAADALEPAVSEPRIGGFGGGAV